MKHFYNIRSPFRRHIILCSSITCPGMYSILLGYCLLELFFRIGSI
jgi:hypothetical protein